MDISLPTVGQGKSADAMAGVTTYQELHNLTGLQVEILCMIVAIHIIRLASGPTRNAP